MVKDAQYQRLPPYDLELICGDYLLDLVSDESGTMIGYIQYRTV
jgi:hypothetical protein